MPRPPRHRPRGHPSVSWLLRSLGGHISAAARVYHADTNDLTLVQQFTTNFLNQASTNGFISSAMWEMLYDTTMRLILDHRSVDILYVRGALEGSLATMFPHDEL
jgi:hypothetical protein